jgi:hypothetical protein
VECLGQSVETIQVVAVDPARLPQAGGMLQITLDARVEAPEIRLAGRACAIETVDGPRITCRAQANQSATLMQPIQVRGTRDGTSIEGWADVPQDPPPFIEMIGDMHAPGGQSVTVVQLGNDGPDLFFTRGSTELPAGVGSHWAGDGPWRWRDVSEGGVVDALAPLFSITPVHLDDDERLDLLLNWGRGRSQNNELVRAFAGSTDFKTTLPVDLPALSPDENVRVLPTTWGGRTGILGVRSATDDLARSVFLLLDGEEQQPAPFTPSADWDAELIYDLAWVDANADGRADLFGCAENSTILRRTASGFEDDPGLLPIIFLYCRTMVTGDLNLDGHVDVVAIGQGTGQRPQNVFQGTRILLGGPDGFTQVERLAPPTACPAPVWVGSALPLGGGTPALVDADLDGDLDILMINPSKACPQAPVLYRNQMVPSGALDFVAEPLSMGWRHISIGAVVVYDLDDDGDSDVVFNGWGYAGRPGIWRNTAVESGATGRMLSVHVQAGGRPVYGAILTATFDDQVRGGISGHSAQHVSDAPVYLPLGDWQGAVALQVRWPDGTTSDHAVDSDLRSIVIEKP